MEIARQEEENGVNDTAKETDGKPLFRFKESEEDRRRYLEYCRKYAMIND